MNILRNFFAALVNLFFGCRHNHLTRLFTLEQQTYKVCLDCGRQIFHSPDTLLPLSARELRRLKATRAGEVKIVPVVSGPRLASAAGQKPNAA
jgi:hypothetical protein